MDAIQIILSIAIVALTVILVLVGAEVFLVLKEIRQSVRKSNKLLTDMGNVSELVTRQVTTITGLFETLTISADLIKKFLGKKEGENSRSEKIVEERNVQTEPAVLVPKKSASFNFSRRFFTRAGRKLS